MDKSLALIILAITVFSFFIPTLQKKRASRRWRLIYLLPLILSAVFAAFIRWDMGYIGIYLGAAVLCGLLYAGDTKRGKIINAAAAVMVLASVIYVFASPMYDRKDYAADFAEGFSQMREHYVLAEEKGIDWEEIYAKYMPLFEEATRTQDKTLNMKSWMQFTQEFYDGHVAYFSGDEDEANSIYCEIFGNDYGLSLLRLSTGEYVAVNVEGSGDSYSIWEPGEEYAFAEDFLSDTAEADCMQLVNAGLHNGSIVTAWDGKPVSELEAQVDVYLESYPDLRNEAFYLPMYAAGKGGESVEITFLDDEGNERNVQARALGAYYPRLKTAMQKLDQGVNISNLAWQQLDSRTVLLRIYQMSYDSQSYDGADYTEMSDEIREGLLAYREQGTERIVIDLRSNVGGSPFMVGGVVSLFAPLGEHVISYSSMINETTASYERGEDGKYVPDKPITYVGEDLFHDGEIILLVNAETVSAGDMICYLMAEYPNVTIMGFTGSNSSCQAVKGLYLEYGVLSFSAVPNLDANADPIIDTLTDHVRRVPIDTIIPLTQDAVIAIYERGEDYLVENL